MRRKYNIAILSEFELVLKIGQCLTEEKINWYQVNDLFFKVNEKIKTGELKLERIGENEISFLLNPAFKVLDIFDKNITKEKIKNQQGFNSVVLENNLKYILPFLGLRNIIEDDAYKAFFIEIVGCFGRLFNEKIPDIKITEELLRAYLEILDILTNPASVNKTDILEQERIIEFKDFKFGLDSKYNIRVILVLIHTLEAIILNQQSNLIINMSLKKLIELLERSIRSNRVFFMFLPSLFELIIKLISRDPLKENSKTLMNVFELLILIMKKSKEKVRGYINGNTVEDNEFGINLSWLDNFRKVLKHIFKCIIYFENHPSKVVRSSYLKVLAFFMIEGRWCINSIESYLLVSLLNLLNDDSDEIKKNSAKTITNLSEEPFYTIDTLPYIYDNFNTALNSTATTIVSKSESEKLSLLRSLATSTLLLGPKVSTIFEDKVASIWLSLCKCLTVRNLDTIEVLNNEKSEELSQILQSDLILHDTNHSQNNMTNHFRYFLEDKTLSEFIQFLNLIGFYLNDIGIFINYSINVLNSPSMLPFHGPTLFLVNHLLYGKSHLSKNPHSVLLYEMHKGKCPIFDDNESVKIYSLSLINNLLDYDLSFKLNEMERVSIDAFPEELEVDNYNSSTTWFVLKDCQVLNLISFTANITGDSFRMELFNLLYFMLEKLGAPDKRVSIDAAKCLNTVQKICGYDNLIEMCHDNMDYLLHCISQRIDPMKIHQPVTFMLSALLKYGQSSDIFLYEDILLQVIDGLYIASKFDNENNYIVNQLLNIIEAMTIPISKCRNEREYTLIKEKNNKSSTKCVSFSESINSTASNTISTFISKYTKDKNEIISLKESIRNTNINLGKEFSKAIFDKEKTDNVSDTYEIEKASLNQDKLLSKCNEYLKHILKICNNYVSYSDQKTRHIILRIIIQITRVNKDIEHYDIVKEDIEECRRPLNTSWHNIWVYIKSFLNESSLDTVLTLKVLIQLLDFTPDFITDRMTKDALPKIFQLLSKNRNKTNPIDFSLNKILNKINFSDRLMFGIEDKPRLIASLNSDSNLEQYYCLTFIEALIKMPSFDSWYKFDILKKLIELGLSKKETDLSIINYVNSSIKNNLYNSNTSKSDKDIYFILIQILNYFLK
ncbi:hypothetical protein K502DRAFT_341840 [Neoconidiobolus thromboides FSU 785]|nr:hypothetical protein K502DRAFT_341840 [Neoconidiobolus thromboides FSU 785]